MPTTASRPPAGRRHPLVPAVLAATVLIGLTACTGADPSPAPSSPGAVGGLPALVVRELDSLDGATVQLTVGQTLDIRPGDVPVDAVEATVWDPDVATFTPGGQTSSYTTDPALVGQKAGETTVTLSVDGGGTDPVSFLLTVAA